MISFYVVESVMSRFMPPVMESLYYLQICGIGLAINARLEKHRWYVSVAFLQLDILNAFSDKYVATVKYEDYLLLKKSGTGHSKCRDLRVSRIPNFVLSFIIFETQISKV